MSTIIEAPGLALHPEHLADLRRSGLSDETIRSAGIRSLSPAEFPSYLPRYAAQKVDHCYLIPYPGTNGFGRVKLFPPILDLRGHSMRYCQPGEIAPYLYLPPLAMKALAQPSIPLLIAEGEKKAIKGDQEGLVCVGTGGVWNWCSGGRPIPDLDRVAWLGRQVLLAPDSDIWNRPDLLRAVYGFGKELERREGKVAILKLPAGENGEKLGLDDYLCRHTVTQMEGLAKLDLAHTAFSEAGLWWERRGQRLSPGLETAVGAGQKGPQDGLSLIPLRDLLEEPDEFYDWVVDQLLPAGGLSLLAGKPKTGKSTLARCLALAVPRGEPWLGRETWQGPVFYLGLEEKRSEVREHFRAMGATPEEQDQIFVFIAPSPHDGLAQLRKKAQEVRPVLIIVDPVLKLVRVRDVNDYAVVSQALEPLLSLARETGAHVLGVHHLGKGERSGGDAVLGSTAIFATVDTLLLLRRTDRYRALSSIQRYGLDLDEITLILDPETRMVYAGPTREQTDQAQVAEAILGYLEEQPGPVEEEAIHNAVKARRETKLRALRSLVDQKKVVRTGEGKRGAPYFYHVAHVEDDREKNPGTPVPNTMPVPENPKPNSSENCAGGGTYSGTGKVTNSVSGTQASAQPLVEVEL